MMSRTFQKTVLEAGAGIYQPNRLATAVVDVVGRWCADGNEVELERREEVTVELDQTDDELGVAVSDMICTMKQGEKSEFVVFSGPQLLLHSLSSCPAPPTGVTVMFTVHLRSFSQGRNVWMLSDQDRLEVAKHHKEQGSELFKSGHLHGAAIRYSRAVQYLAAVDPDTPLEVENLEDYEQEIITVRTLSLLNLAACQLKFNQFNHVVSNCSKVLEVEPSNVKAFYRRGKAHLAMKDFEASKDDLLKAKEIDPTNHALDELLRTVEVQEAAHKAKYKDALKTMFN